LYFFAPLGERLRLPVTGVLIGTAFVFLAGLADDKYEFKPGPQLLVQIVAALIAIAATVFIEEVTLPIFGLQHFQWYITYPLTLVWVVGMMNTVNLLDGLDGLASGVGAIAALLFAIHSYSRWQQQDTPLYSLALAGACLGFLVFNFHPARAFLGSAGAMTLGFALATLSILTPARVATALLVMAIPIADAAFQLFDRWRRGQSPGQGDRGHLHYRLMDLGLSQRQIVLGYWGFCAVFGALALFIPAPNYKLMAIGVLGLLVVAVLVMLSRRQKSQTSNSKDQTTNPRPE
jgi:UDP-GlcNAc:undecaprenyl-phosphate GlcNAc-1-phosphate transferase